MQDVEIMAFADYEHSVFALLDRVGAGPVLAGHDRIMLKPNLVNASPFPVTTPPALCEAVVRYVRSYAPGAEVTIAEGCGDNILDTDEIFARLGYADLARRMDVRLLDLNYAPCVRLENPDCRVFPEMHLPEEAMDSFLISLPVLKAHSFSGITGTLKNMMGLAPPEHYAGAGGSWKKAVFHLRMQESLMDLACYRAPDLSLMDATVGLSDYHLGGRPCSPPPEKLIAGFDAWAVDRKATTLLGQDWRSIRHLAERPRAVG